MYQSYKFTAPGWKIIDTDFVDHINDHIVSLWSAIIKVYEQRRLDVVKNLILAIISFKQTDLSKEALFKCVIDNTKMSDTYREELEKYMMLL